MIVSFYNIHHIEMGIKSNDTVFRKNMRGCKTRILAKWTSTVDCVFKEANYNKLVADKKFHDSCLYLDPQCPSSWSSTVQYLNLKKEERK